MKAAYKWRLQNGVYAYITDENNNGPFIYYVQNYEREYQNGEIVSASTVNDGAIASVVSKMSKDEYISEFNTFKTFVLSKFPQTSFLDVMYYYNVETDECVTSASSLKCSATDLFFNVASVVTGDTADVTIVAENSDLSNGQPVVYDISFVIPKGPGGQPGETPNIQIGQVSVTTLQSTDNASVSVSRDPSSPDSDPILDFSFGIPRGKGVDPNNNIVVSSLTAETIIIQDVITTSAITSSSVTVNEVTTTAITSTDITTTSITSDNFVKNGGTSEQYLMADGSVSVLSAGTHITISSSVTNGVSVVTINGEGDTTYSQGRNITIDAGNTINAEGYTYNSGVTSIAIGGNTIASGKYSHAEGFFEYNDQKNVHIGYTYDQRLHAYFFTADDGEQPPQAIMPSVGDLIIDTNENVVATVLASSSSSSNFTVGQPSVLVDYIDSHVGTQDLYIASPTKATGKASHAEGCGTIASGISSHSEGISTISSGVSSHAEGINTISYGYASHSEGGLTTASGEYSHASGYLTIASGNNSYAGGGGFDYETESQRYSDYTVYIQTGISTQIGVYYFLVYGADNIQYCPSEGTILFKPEENFKVRVTGNVIVNTQGVVNPYSGTTVDDPVALRNYLASHTSYSMYAYFPTISSGVASHAEGDGTIADQDSQFVCGDFNTQNNIGTKFVVGGGTSSKTRADAFVVRKCDQANTAFARVNRQQNIVLGVPVGTVMLWSETTIGSHPDGWLVCDGTKYAITQYQELYNVIQEDYDHSVSAGHFAVPNITTVPLSAMRYIIKAK